MMVGTPLQLEGGTMSAAVKRVPAGSILGPILAGFNTCIMRWIDGWIKSYPHCSFERYADDAIILH